MQKQQVLRIIGWSTVALIIPILGQLLVSGWNWDIGDFVFAWVFFNLLGLVYVYVTSKVTRRSWKIVAGVAVVAVFAFVWIRLATG